MNEIKYFESKVPLHLESGEILPSYRIAYQTFGTLNSDASNVVWIIHALTADSNPIGWWPGVVGQGEVLDPSKHFIICANTLGSHYGSTNALDINPTTGNKYYHTFPLLTNRDIVHSFIALKNHLGISRIHALVGSSLGGQQATEWAIMENDAIQNLILIATNAQHSPYGIAFNESQRMAIAADGTWRQNRDDAGVEGMKVARSIGLLSYRTASGYDLTQKEYEEKIDDFKASSYQKYQGEKLAKRFNAFSYWTLSKAMDSHHVGRGRGGIETALSTITANTTVLGIDSDFLFPPSEQKLLANKIRKAKYYEISSALGHDGFLTESKRVSEIIEIGLKENTIIRTIEKAS